jgi:hypothetical protein
MAIQSLQTQHNEHTMYEQPAHHGNDILVEMMDRFDDMVTACQIKPGL